MNVVADPNQVMERMKREKAKEFAKKLEEKDNPVAKAVGKIIEKKAEMDEISDRIIVH